MDPLTQGVLGASLPQSLGKARDAASAGLLGFLAGMSADLDVLIRSTTDPLLFLEYHRQFTHSLIFIPIGGVLCALLLHALIGRRRGLRFRQTWLFCTLGYATHALLDACTTYGTMLLWPFSEQRFAWNTISIIDPLFTLPLLVGVLLAAKKRHAAVCPDSVAVGLLLYGPGIVAAQCRDGYGLCTGRAARPPALAPGGQAQLCQYPGVEDCLRNTAVLSRGCGKGELGTPGIPGSDSTKAGNRQGYALAGSVVTASA